MEVSYTLPLQLAYERMKRALFTPFDLSKWLVIGFAAWLAHLPGGGYGGTPPTAQWNVRQSPEEMARGVSRFINDYVLAALGGALLVFAITVAACLIVALLWLSSRAKFVFLDNVVHDRARIVEPWKTFGSQGNSLFLWRLGFGVVCLAALAAVVGAPPWFAYLAGARDGSLVAAFLAGLALAGLVVGIPAAYIGFFLESFVVPIMFRDRVSTTEAWRRFRGLFRARAREFIVFGLFVLALAIGVLIAVAAAGCMTCCVGYLVISLPYIGAVALLPVSYTYRALGPEFLAQFGAEYSVWVREDAEPPVPQPPY